jgi:hypothetical protein
MIGLFVIPEQMPIGQTILDLELIALASISEDWHNQLVYLPL